MTATPYQHTTHFTLALESEHLLLLVSDNLIIDDPIEASADWVINQLQETREINKRRVFWRDDAGWLELKHLHGSFDGFANVSPAQAAMCTSLLGADDD